MLKREFAKLFISLICCFTCPFLRAGINDGIFLKTDDGVIVYPKNTIPGSSRAVRLEVITANIIRVTSSPNERFADRQSLVISYIKVPGLKWEMVNITDHIGVKTGLMGAMVDVLTGNVSFTGATGNEILHEKQTGEKNFEPAVFDGEPSYHINKFFQTSADDAYYGLGQHQDDVFNYKGRQAEMFQNNTQVAVPFLVSKKNYGILWDNYAISSIGDTRHYMPLSALKLFDREGNMGWLSSVFSNDKNNLAQGAFEQAVSNINYEFIGDTKQYLPANFDMARGQVAWSGSFASGVSGLHTFRFTYAGYIKVWIDGQMVLDRWRQAWNPGAASLQANLEKDKKYAIRIEWIPDGTESYLSMKWLDPIPASAINDLGFSSEAGQQADYYFISGQSMDEVIGGYRILSGKAPMVPKWALGFWQSRERYKTQEEVLNTISEFRKRKIPIDNIVLDWSYWKENAWGSQDFDLTRFPNADSMISMIHNQYQAHFMISVWPKFYEGIPEFKNFYDKGWLYKRNVANRQADFKGYVSTFYDVFNKDAQKGFWDLLNKKLYTKGVDAFWMDASEPDILSNASPEQRKEEMRPVALGIAAEYLNAYPLQNAKGIYEGQRSVNNNQRVFTLTRSAFAGSQRYAAAVWSGDIAARWTDMKAQISAGINFSMSGIPYWTMDIGGFAVEHRYEHATGKDLEEWREQMTRWYQFGAFCPLFRVHGQYPYREIFNTAPEDHPAYKSMLYYDRLRYRLMPYIYGVAGKTYHDNYTIMRGLVMDYPADTVVTASGDEYMFGPSLLVAPVYTYKSSTRAMYLPKGNGWYDLYSGKYQDGGHQVNADAPYERVPVLVKEGSIIPFGPELQYTAEKPARVITLYVYTGRDAHFSVYEDEDINYNYEKGAYANIPIDYNEASKTLTIGRREGRFKGMLNERVFHIVWVTKNKPAALDFDRKPDVIVKYDGSQKTCSR